jgi:hypothetical protein
VRNSGATTDIKFDVDTRPSNINGQTGNQGQVESLLAENDIFAARVDGTAISIGTKISSESLSDRFDSPQDAVDTAVTTSDGVTLVEAQQSGPYDAFNIPSDGTDAQGGFLLKATGTERPVISGTAEIFSASAGTRPDGVTVEGLRFEGPSNGPAFTVETGGSGDTHDNLTFRDNEFVASDVGVDADNIKNSTFENNLFTVAQNKTAKELLSLGNRTDSNKNGDDVDVTNNDFQTPVSTSLERSGQSANAVEFGPNTGDITGNNFNVDVNVKVLIGQHNQSINGESELSDKQSDISDNNTGVTSDEVELSPLDS